ncbi:MAG: protein-L-isoaspartate(D-aspartate) O-methyltransferase [Candidatus Margulisiibacteriota bacterium]
MDFEKLRQEMVETQLIPRRISDKKVLGAFRKVPRHFFVPENVRASAYDDCALPIGEGQTISQPYMVAVMSEQLKLKGDEKVLEIGTGSGYQAAILAELCQKVYTLERIQPLSERAEKIIKEQGYPYVECVVGDGTQGYPEAAPYEGIIVTAGCPEIPEPLIKQLKDGGRLVIPVGDRYQQILTTVTKHGTEIETEESILCVFVPLVGKFGWQA